MECKNNTDQLEINSNTIKSRLPGSFWVARGFTDNWNLVIW